MLKKVLYIIILLSCFSATPGAETKPGKILIMPFKNLGKPETDGVSTEITLYIFSIILGEEDFSVVNIHEAKKILENL